MDAACLFPFCAELSAALFTTPRQAFACWSRRREDGMACGQCLFESTAYACVFSRDETTDGRGEQAGRQPEGGKAVSWPLLVGIEGS